MSKESNGMSGCLKGCAIVAGLGLIVMIAAAIGGYFLFRAGFEKLNTEGKAEMVSALKGQVKTWKEEDKLPPDKLPTVDELVTLVEEPEVSFASVALSVVVLQSVFDDGKVSSVEDALLVDALDFIKQNPNAGFIEMGKFFSRHPEIQGASEKMSEKIRKDVHELSERKEKERRERMESGPLSKPEEPSAPALEKEEVSAPNAGQ